MVVVTSRDVASKTTGHVIAMPRYLAMAVQGDENAGRTGVRNGAGLDQPGKGESSREVGVKDRDRRSPCGITTVMRIADRPGATSELATLIVTHHQRAVRAARP